MAVGFQVIHQIWMNPKENGIMTYPPKKTQRLMDQYKEMCEKHGIKYILWNGDSMIEYIKKTEPGFLDFYQSLPMWINRCDIFRFFVIYHMGGIYLDADINPQGDFIEWLAKNDVKAFVANGKRGEVTNFAMGSYKGHEFFKQCYLNVDPKESFVFASAGPSYLGKMYHQYKEKYPELKLISETHLPFHHLSDKAWVMEQIECYMLPFYIVLLFVFLFIALLYFLQKYNYKSILNGFNIKRYSLWR